MPYLVQTAYDKSIVVPLQKSL